LPGRLPDCRKGPGLFGKEASKKLNNQRKYSKNRQRIITRHSLKQYKKMKDLERRMTDY